MHIFVLFANIRPKFLPTQRVRPKVGQCWWAPQKLSGTPNMSSGTAGPASRRRRRRRGSGVRGILAGNGLSLQHRAQQLLQIIFSLDCILYERNSADWEQRRGSSTAAPPLSSYLTFPFPSAAPRLLPSQSHPALELKPTKYKTISFSFSFRKQIQFSMTTHSKLFPH